MTFPNPLPSRSLRQALGVLIVATLTSITYASDPLPVPSRKSVAPSWCGERCDELVIDWNATAYQVIKANDGYQDPLKASRALAMMHLAMHDAVNFANPRYATYATIPQDAVADPALAAVTAAHDVLAALYPTQQPLLKAALDKSATDAGRGVAAERGIALGKRVAAAILEMRAGDGSAEKLTYQEGSKPGEYRFTPGWSFVFHPHWRAVTPFALTSASQFRSAPPPPLTTARYATDLNEVRVVGGKGAGTKRTPDETHYAAFWYEFSDIGWNRIARVVARDHAQDLWQRARTFALLNVVLADAYIAGWDAKFHYNLWRPVTAIHWAEADGNPQTSADASFAPLLPTPPVQDYPSTHSALGAAGATVLAEAFGSDQIRFTFTSTTALPANPAREFASFSQAARENADSRVKAGLHFRFATIAGLELGEHVGRFAIANRLTPID